MPVFVAWIIGTLLASIVFRILSYLGIGIITYYGAEYFINQLVDFIDKSFAGLPPQISQVFGVLNIDKFMSIVLSAYLIRIAISALKGSNKKIGLL